MLPLIFIRAFITSFFTSSENGALGFGGASPHVEICGIAVLKAFA